MSLLMRTGLVCLGVCNLLLAILEREVMGGISDPTISGVEEKDVSIPRSTLLVVSVKAVGGEE